MATTSNAASPPGLPADPVPRTRPLARLGLLLTLPALLLVGLALLLPLGLNRSATAEGGVTRAVMGAIDRVRRRLPRHVIMLDTAPCLSTSDPSTLAPSVDMVVMVVEAGRTQRSELGAALELVRACPNITMVLNKVRLTHRHSFGSYYYFGYPS